MKRVVLLAITALVVLSLTACNGSSGEKKNAKADQTLNGVILEEGWTLFEENENGKMVAAAQSEKGEVVAYYVEHNDPVSKTANRLFKNGTEKEYTFYKVLVDGKTYWTIEFFLAHTDVVPALITDDCRVFSEPKDTTMTKKSLKAGDTVAFRSNVDGYAEVVIYDGSVTIQTVYVPEEAVNSNADYIEVVKTQKKLDGTKNLDPRVRAEVEQILGSITR